MSGFSVDPLQAHLGLEIIGHHLAELDAMAAGGFQRGFQLAHAISIR